MNVYSQMNGGNGKKSRLGDQMNWTESCKLWITENFGFLILFEPRLGPIMLYSYIRKMRLTADEIPEQFTKISKTFAHIFAMDFWIP